MNTATSNSDTVRQLLNEKDASQIIGASTPTLRKSRCTGTLFGIPAPKHLKIGRTIRYKTSDLNDWVSNLTHAQEL